MSKTKHWRIGSLALAVVVAVAMCFSIMTINTQKAFAINYQDVEVIDLTVKLPKCGTEIKVTGEPAQDDYDDDENVVQSPVPEVKVNSEGVMLACDDYDDFPTQWYPNRQIIGPFFANKEKVRFYEYKKVDLFAGVVKSGSDIWVKVPLSATEGFRFNYGGDWVVDQDTDAGYYENDVKVTVNGKQGKLVMPSGTPFVIFKLDTSALVHDWDEGKVTTAPAPGKSGVKTFTCKGCGMTKTETIPAEPAPAPTPSTGKAPILAAMVAKDDNAMKFTWTKAKGAAGYDIFLARCNTKTKKYEVKKVKSIKGNKKFKWVKKGLREKTAYKAYIKPFKKTNGKKKYIGKTKMMHAFTTEGNKKFTNPKAVKLKKGSVSLKTGKSSKIKASVERISSDKKLISDKHGAKLRYVSSNSKIAKVSKKGKVTAVAAGKCKIYVMSISGVRAAVKVTVK